MLPSTTHMLLDRDLFQQVQDIQNGAKSALSAAATRVVDAADQAQSAISSVATSLQDMEERLPRNCSLGTKRFCIGYEHESSCSDLPLNLSGLLPASVHDLPAPVEDAIRDRAEALSRLAGTSSKLPAVFVPGTLISGLVSMSAIAVLSLCLAFRWLPCATKILSKLNVWLRALALLSLGLACCSPLILLALFLDTILRAADELPSWVEVERGEACVFCYGGLACALVLTLLVTASPAIGTHAPRKESEGRN